MREEQLLRGRSKHIDCLTDRVEWADQRLELDTHRILDREWLTQFSAAQVG